MMREQRERWAAEKAHFEKRVAEHRAEMRAREREIEAAKAALSTEGRAPAESSRHHPFGGVPRRTTKGEGESAPAAAPTPQTQTPATAPQQPQVPAARPRQRPPATGPRPQPPQQPTAAPTLSSSPTPITIEEDPAPTGQQPQPDPATTEEGMGGGWRHQGAAWHHVGWE